MSLSTKAIVKTIATTQPSNGTGLVQSIGLSPDGTEVLAVLNGLSFPGDVMATVNTSTNTISSTVSLETGTDAMGQLVSDGTRGYVWVTDETNGGDVIQNLNLAVSDPASQPDVTSVGGTSLGHGARTLGPPPTEQVWNDALYYSEGAGGGGISTTFTMPAYQQALGVVSGSTGTPCANAGGDCREVPDVSADADPSSGYIIFDSVNGLNWNALGGTSGAAPLWASVLAVVASADGNTAGYGLLNPALYLLAQQSPGTYLNDVTTGTNDYNATASGEYPALAGYDMATGLGDTGGIGAGGRSLRHSPDRGRVRDAALRGVSDVHGNGQLRRVGYGAVRRDAQHERAHLFHRGDFDDHQSVLGHWQYTCWPLLAVVSRSVAPTAPTMPSSTAA